MIADSNQSLILSGLSTLTGQQVQQLIVADLTAAGYTTTSSSSSGAYVFPNVVTVVNTTVVNTAVVSTGQVTTSSTVWTLGTASGIFLSQSTPVLTGIASIGGHGGAQSTSSAHVTSLMINSAVGSIAWYLVGYAFSYGRSLDSRLRNRFIGNYVFALHRIRESNHNTTSYGYGWFFQSLCYALVCNAIVAQAMGSRASRLAHVLSTAYTVAFLFPVIAHWVWSTDGWLSAIRPETEPPIGTIGAIDFAGSGVVHLLGASISLAASLFLRRAPQASADTPKAGSQRELAMVLAAFLRVFSMYWFTVGSCISIGGGATIVVGTSLASALGVNPGTVVPVDANDAGMAVASGRASVCLTLSIATSLLTVMLAENWMSPGAFGLEHATNGLTIGFAAICSNVLTCEPWAAMIAGLVAGMIYVGGRRALRGIRDNNTFVVHGLGGLWGLLFTGLLAKPKFIRDVIGVNFYPSRLAVSYFKGDR